MTVAALTTLTAVKQYLPVNQASDGSLTSGRDDTLLNETITAYTDAVNDYLGWYIQPVTVAAKIYTREMSPASRIVIGLDGTLSIRTFYPTIQAVTSMAYKTVWSAAWTPIAVTLIQTETLSENERPTSTSFQIQCVPQSGPWLSWRYPFKKFWVQASFTAGYATIPPVLARACAEWIGFDYRLRGYIPTMSSGFIGFNTVQVTPARIPPHIAQLLDGWKRVW
jgi:hypothetical protein